MARGESTRSSIIGTAFISCARDEKLETITIQGVRIGMVQLSSLREFHTTLCVLHSLLVHVDSRLRLRGRATFTGLRELAVERGRGRWSVERIAAEMSAKRRREVHIAKPRLGRGDGERL
jgi:hypothetical protein